MLACRIHFNPWIQRALSRAALLAVACAPIPAVAQTQSCTPAIEAHQALGLATVTVVTPCRKDPRQTFKVFYDDDVFLAHFDASGRASLSFVLLRPAGNEVKISLGEGAAETRILDVPDFDRFFRVVLIWQTPMRLSLHIVEPGHILGQDGDISEDQPNLDLRRGLGKLDLAGGAPELDRLDEETSGEQAYLLLEAPSEQQIFSAYLGSPSRGATPQLPFCGTGKLASSSYRFIVLDRGKVTDDTTHQSAAADCGVTLQRRLQRIQWRGARI